MDTTSESDAKERRSNFSEIEKMRFVELFAEHKEILQHWSRKPQIIELKKHLWEKITQEMNETVSSHAPHTVGQLQTFWKNISLRTRHRFRENKLTEAQIEENPLLGKILQITADTGTDSGSNSFDEQLPLQDHMPTMVVAMERAKNFAAISAETLENFAAVYNMETATATAKSSDSNVSAGAYDDIYEQRNHDNDDSSFAVYGIRSTDQQCISAIRSETDDANSQSRVQFADISDFPIPIPIESENPPQDSIEQTDDSAVCEGQSATTMVRINDEFSGNVPTLNLNRNLMNTKSTSRKSSRKSARTRSTLFGTESNKNQLLFEQKPSNDQLFDSRPNNRNLPLPSFSHLPPNNDYQLFGRKPNNDQLFDSVSNKKRLFDEKSAYYAEKRRRIGEKLKQLELKNQKLQLEILSIDSKRVKYEEEAEFYRLKSADLRERLNKI